MSMVTAWRAACAVALVAAMAGSAAAQPASKHPDVVKGVKQVEDGEFDAAIITLDTAVRTLSKAGAGHTNDLARAYLYLGIAYLGKGQETAAKARFRDALSQVGDMNLPAEKFAPKVIEAFEKAKDDTRGNKGGGGSKTPLLIGGGVLVAGGAAALALGGGGGDEGDGSGDFYSDVQTFTGTIGGTGRESSSHVVTPRKAGTMEVNVSWSTGSTSLTLACQAQDPPYTPCDGQLTRPSGTSVRLTARVQQKQYLLSVGNFQTASEPFTMTVKLP
jgi:hypothetical protein